MTTNGLIANPNATPDASTNELLAGTGNLGWRPADATLTPVLKSQPHARALGQTHLGAQCVDPGQALPLSEPGEHLAT